MIDDQRLTIDEWRASIVERFDLDFGVTTRSAIVIRPSQIVNRYSSIVVANRHSSIVNGQL